VVTLKFSLYDYLTRAGARNLLFIEFVCEREREEDGGLYCAFAAAIIFSFLMRPGY
jgi:hypothetical protein